MQAVFDYRGAMAFHKCQVLNDPYGYIPLIGKGYIDERDMNKHL